MVFSILSIGPASAVQIESINQFNINGTITDKNIGNNITTFDNNSTILDSNNNTMTNQTVINETIGLNGTKVNNTNGTGINETFVNNTNKTGDKFDYKSAVTTTLSSVAGICAAGAGICAAVAGICAVFPDATWTKVVAVGFGIGAGLFGAAAAFCYVGSIINSWLHW